MQLIEDLCEYGASAIANLQDTFPNGDKFFMKVNKVSDPDYAFSILFPLFAVVSGKLATDVLAVNLVAEWLNTLLKWLLMEHRPYCQTVMTVVCCVLYMMALPSRWVKERELLTKYPVPLLRQTKQTCETGPGSPSGHVMGCAAVLYAVIRFINDTLSRNQRISVRTKNYVRTGLWMVFALMMALVTASRLYVAAHFPHQCFLGIFGGLFVAKMLLWNPQTSSWWKLNQRPKMLLAALGMAMIAFGSYWFQKGLGIDPQWSIKLAFKWCSTPEWISVNTTPLFSLVRDNGSAFGLALIAPIEARISHSSGPSSTIVKGALIGCLTIAMQLAQSAIPTDRVIPFYLCQFMLYAVQPYLYLVTVPFLATHRPPAAKSD